MDTILEHVAPRTPAMDETTALLKEMELAGVDIKGAKQELDQQDAVALKQRHLDLNTKMSQLESQRQAAGIQGGVFDTLAGVGTAVRSIVQNVYNGAVDVADKLENFAASKGLGAGDLISGANKIDLVQGLDKNLDMPGKVANAVTQFVTPLAATMASGGSFAVGMGVNAAYNFLAIDPKSLRLSDHLKDTSFAEMPVAASLIDALQTKPTDSELEARTKNMLEGASLDLTLGGLVWGASKVYGGISKLRNAKDLRKTEQMVASAEAAPIKVSEPVVPKPNEPVVPNPDIPQAKVQQTPDVPSVPTTGVSDTPEQLSLFEKEWAKMGYEEPRISTTPEGAVRVRLSDDKIVDRFVQVASTNEGQILRTPISDAEITQAAEILRKDPAVIDRLANWKQGDPVITDQETLVMKYVMQQADSSFMDSVSKAVENINDDVSLVRFYREFENYQRVLQAKTGMASAKGATLRAEQIIGNLAATGDKEAIKQLGAQGRANLVKELLDNYGGREGIQQAARDLDLIKSFGKIAAKPDSDFSMRMGQVVELSTWNKINQAITKVAINGMLSSPMTPFKAAITNAATTAKTAIDNYVAVGIGAIRGNQSRQTIAEANAQMSGMVEGLIDNIKPALKGDKVYRIDVAEGRKKILGYDDAMFNATGAWVKAGMAVENAVEVPAKVSMSVDAYWHGVNMQGYLRGEALRRAVSQGLEGAEKNLFIERFLAKPPQDVLYFGDKIASTNTMAKNLEGVAKTFDDLIKGAGDYIPLARVALPFFKTNANLVEYAIKNSFLAPISNEFRTAISKGGREADMVMAKAFTGTVAMGVLAYLAHNKLIIGTPLDPKLDRALKDNKSIPQETSVWTGNEWVSLKGLEPISTFVNIASLMNRASGYVDQGDYQNAAISAGLMAADILTPEQITGSIASIMDIVKGKQSGKDFLAQVPSRLLPFGAALQDARQMQDTKNRVVKGEDFYQTLLNNFKNKIPGLSKELPAQRNIWGEVLHLPDAIGVDAMSPFATSDGKGLELKNTLEAMDNYYETHKHTNFGLYKLDISMPSKVIPNALASSVPYEMTPKEQEVYTVMAAGIDPFTGKNYFEKGSLKQVVEKAIKTYIDPKVPIAQQDPSNYAKAVAEIQGTITAYKNFANKKIMDYGRVGSKMGEAAQKFRTLEMGGNNVGQ